MTYKELFPELVIRDRETIKETLESFPFNPNRDSIINARIDALLEDAFLRGRSYGIRTVLSDPGAYDLFSHQERD